MKKLLIALIIAILSLSLTAGVAMAGGDQVHGDKAAGDPGQSCINFGFCPWE